MRKQPNQGHQLYPSTREYITAKAVTTQRTACVRQEPGRNASTGCQRTGHEERYQQHDRKNDQGQVVPRRDALALFIVHTAWRAREVTHAAFDGKGNGSP